MNTKAIVSILVLLVLIGAGYLILHTAPAVAPSTEMDTTLSASSTVNTASTTSARPTPQSSKPTVRAGEPIKTIVHKSVSIDPASLTSTSPYPMITGTAKNTTALYIVVRDVGGTGITAATVSVTDGTWSYPLAVALEPGTYMVTVAIDGHTVVSTPLVVKRS